MNAILYRVTTSSPVGNHVRGPSQWRAALTRKDKENTLLAYIHAAEPHQPAARLYATARTYGTTALPAQKNPAPTKFWLPLLLLPLLLAFLGMIDSSSPTPRTAIKLGLLLPTVRSPRDAWRIIRNPRDSQSIVANEDARCRAPPPLAPSLTLARSVYSALTTSLNRSLDRNLAVTTLNRSPFGRYL